MELTTSKKNSIIGHSIALVVGVALMIIASFYDLKISQAVGDQRSFFGQLFAVIAEYPAYFAVPIAGVIIFYNYDVLDSKKAKIGIMIAGALVIWLGWLMFGLNAQKMTELAVVPTEQEHNVLWAIFKAFFYGAFTLGIGYFLPRDTMHRLLKWAVFSLVFVIVALVVMRVMKVLWCRMRYRDMLKEGSFDGFSNWWQLMIGREKLDPSYKYTSFPSGHSSSITHLCLLWVLCDILPSLKSRKWVKPTVYAVSIILIGLTMYSRIVNCAHFLSDTVAGVYITYAIFFVLKKVFFAKDKYTYAISDRALSQEEVK
ncbi:MAG: phosphatase PAP2 family protein [Clostridia bacterium]|nr:phosphatase PAP2 family protein [Clostridia bacterium]MDY4083896.1 phosphatase PAP2 family protein [Eubacteriales bacterium]